MVRLSTPINSLARQNPFAKVAQHWRHEKIPILFYFRCLLWSWRYAAFRASGFVLPTHIASSYSGSSESIRMDFVRPYVYS